MTRILDVPDSILARIDTLLGGSAPRRLGDLPYALLLLFPALSIIAVFGVFPLVFALQISAYGGKYGKGPFVGLGNYAEAFASPEFWRSVLVTVYYAAGTIVPTLLLAFLIASALNRIVWGRGFFRTLYFLPYVTSIVAAAMIWRALFNTPHGVFNQLLTLTGLPTQQWLLEPRGILHLLSGGAIGPWVGPSLALCCIMLFDIWHSLGLAVVVFLAGLTTIPRELIDAARIDGASPMQVTRRITLPLLSPTLLFLVIVSTIHALQAFNSFYAMTQGGGRVLGTTENLVIHIYTHFYESGYWGYGSAVAVLLSAAIVFLTVLQWRWASGRMFYE